MRSSQAERLTSESVEEREARLQQLRDRLAAESIEEREVRLQQMGSSQRERLAPENAEEREVRLRHDKREPQGAASAGNTWPVASPTYSTAICTSQDAEIPCTYGCTGGVDVARIQKHSQVCNSTLSVYAVAGTDIHTKCSPPAIRCISAPFY